MGLLTFYSGLLLPWLGGALWLAFIETRVSGRYRPTWTRQLGYGFFAGYAVLFLAITVSGYLAGTVSWPLVMGFLLIFAGTGASALRASRNRYQPRPPPARGAPTATTRLLAIVLLVWMGIHLLFVAVEVFTQSLFPWDAWVVWVYRAKAWYLTGGISDMVSNATWITTQTPDTHTIGPYTYPLMASVIPYWAALSLGRWSETLINVPALLAGVAIGLALYGQCREQGLDKLPALVCCYLLSSLPLFGTHIALAGYADLWMAGYTGLGFIALLRGADALTRGDRTDPQLWLGLLMIGMGVAVKKEGMVWLLTALLLLLATTCRPRVPLLILLTMGVTAALGYALGITWVDLPFGGPLGWVEGQISIPFIGRFTLEAHNIWPVYWENFFAMGSWNLLWVLVAACMFPAFKMACGSSRIANGRILRRNGRILIGLLLVTQFFIFGLTGQGQWADSFTAINRLPLQFVPVLLFTAFIVAHSHTDQRGPDQHDSG